jgi:carboxylesterase type B
MSQNWTPYKHEHSQLGSLTGRLIDTKHFDGTKVKHPVVHFRSIPYATIPARFKQSVLLEHIAENFDSRPARDFTEYGYACPQIPQSRDAIGGILPGERDRQYDEFACLNLTISAPVSHLQPDLSNKLLPVMVYIHGGGFMEGAGHVSASHDTTKMADLGAAEGMPVILVNIGYRLNYQGFLACQDLIDEATEETETGNSREPLFNYGFRDQRNAFYWIKKFIGGFGGDPNNITAFGESAGSASISAHIYADVPLFKRAILQSGTIGALDTFSKEQHEQRYRQLLQGLGINEDTGAARLKALRAAPIEKLVDWIKTFQGTTFHPYDGPEAEFYLERPTWTNQADLFARSWVEDIIIGDTFYEGYIMSQILKYASQKKFVATVRDALGQAGSDSVLNAYDIDPNGMDQNLFWTNIMMIGGDTIFAEPNEHICEVLTRSNSPKKRRVYRYQFCMPNPFPGTPFSFVHGHHFVDLLYQFMNLTFRYPKHRDHFLERQAVGFARAWIRFGNGLEPWENSAYDPKDKKIAICDDLRGWQVRTRAEDEEISKDDPWGPRRYKQYEILREELRKAGKGHHATEADAEAARNKLLLMQGYLEF